MGAICIGIAVFLGLVTVGVIGGHQPASVNANKCQALQDGADISTTHCDDNKK